jgi:cysteine desulfuration protein SufE
MRIGISTKKDHRKFFLVAVRCGGSKPPFSTKMKTVEQQLIEEFSIFEDWMEKYDHLISIGKSLKTLDEQYKLEENLIQGCQSRVWLHSELKDGHVFFTADSDTTITKGMISILIRVFSGRTASEIINGNLDFVSQIGLMQHISSTRSNGLLNMFKQMKENAKNMI